MRWTISLLLVVVASAAADEQPLPSSAKSRDTVAEQFVRADRDGDGYLSFGEFLSEAEPKSADGQRRFQVFDFDVDGKLSLGEYRSLCAPPNDRGNVPDPMVALEQAAIENWQRLFAAADGDASGGLTRAEWPRAELAADLPALADTFFSLWDLDRDDRVTLAEGRRVLETAYGLVLHDGRPLRTRAGHVFNLSAFRKLDVDGNGRLSREEFVSGNSSGRDTNAALFAKCDGDRDGQLSFEEAWQLPGHDMVSAFIELDRDGSLALDTLFVHGVLGNNVDENLGRRMVRAFDDDFDGTLSFAEFRRTPLANPSSDWFALRLDKDHDRRLSWQEFCVERAPFLVGQSRYFFDRFDLNRDGFLSFVEFDFDGSGFERAQANLAFEPLERRLSMEIQLARIHCQPDKGQDAALRIAAMNAFVRVGEKIIADLGGQPANAGRGIVVVNGRGLVAPAGFDQDLLTAPQRAFRRELTQALKTTSPDLAQKLDVEAQRLDRLHKRAAIRIQVAGLDEVLLLSIRQRDDLCNLIDDPVSDAWWRPDLSAAAFTSEAQQLLGAVGGGKLGALNIPEVWLAKFLTPRQLECYQELQRPRREEMILVEEPAPPAAVKAPPGMVAPRRIQRRLVRRGPILEDQQRQLHDYLTRSVDDLEAACGLTKSQREKLLVAGSLDINHWRELLPPPEKLPEGQKVVVQQVNVAGPAPALPVAMFGTPGSYYQKVLQSQLIEEQKQKLLAAEKERRLFQQQAIVEAVVCGYEHAASLTAAQCDELSRWLNDRLPQADYDASRDWRTECLRRLVAIAVERDRAVFGFQRPAAGEHRMQLGRIPVQVADGRPIPLGQIEVGAPLPRAPPNAAPAAARPAANIVVD